ncbi:hypothetical protein BGW80DRAFT_1353387 [Lactifluus volemus]|nr:hypothetical protein BGW80DRAFT_1353387 [Lactifluus volemus]
MSSLFDKIKDKLTPEPSGAPLSTSASRGSDDNMIVSKPAIICHCSQAFFSFLAMCCFASVAAFQAHWNIGPSGLTGFALFVSIAGMFLALVLLLFTRVARALKEDRAMFVLVGAGTALTFLIAFITTISAWTEPGCKNAKDDPHAKELGDSFTNGLGGWCSTKKAGVVFFWLALVSWVGSFTLAFLEWRKNKASRPRDPPFEHPPDAEEGYEESAYEVPSLHQDHGDDSNSPFADTYRYSGASSAARGDSAAFSSPGRYNIPSAPQPRPSLDAYGAFSDPTPSGFGDHSGDSGVAGISRTMQYADPYAAVRASITSPPTAPPSYR